MLNTYLNIEDFYTYAGLTSSDVNSAYLTKLIDSYNKVIQKKLGKIFQFSESDEKIYERNGRQILYFGNYQRPGVVKSLIIADGGAGYSDTPLITVDGDGEDAEVEVTVTGGVITAAKIINQGKNYTVAPTIVITDDTGHDAVITAEISTLTFTIGDDGYTPELPLVIERDYRLQYFKNDDDETIYPVVGIQMYWDKIRYRRFIRIVGTKGYSPQVPDELLLNYKIYDMLKRLILSAGNETSNGGRGLIKSAHIDRISRVFETGIINGVYTAEQAMNKLNTMIANIASSYQIQPGDTSAIIER